MQENVSYKLAEKTFQMSLTCLKTIVIVNLC